MAIAKNCEDFPRSDGDTFKKKLEAGNLNTSENDQLFKRKRHANSVKLNRNKKIKSNATEDGQLVPVEVDNKIIIENMTLAKLMEGQIIYGCIQEINDFEISFSITGGIDVKVPITNISNPYTKLIEDFANEDTVSDDINIAKLCTIFQLGDYYPLAIMSKKLCEQFGHTEIIGSINPKDVHKNLTAKSIEGFPTNYRIFAAVASNEDYGYEMDIGVEGVKAFLPFQDLKKHMQCSTLHIGQLVSCSILRHDQRTIILTTEKKLSNFCVNESHEPSIHIYLPGTNVKCVITGVHNSGFEISLPGDYKGFISRYHIDDNFISPTKKYEIGDSVVGHVLFVQPYIKQVCISLQQKLSRKMVKNLLNKVKIGLIIENAVVCGSAEFGTVILDLPSYGYGKATRKNLCNQDEYETLKLNGHFSVGTTHRCRVKRFNLFDKIVEVSLKKSFLERDYISIDDIDIGSIVEGTVKSLVPNGVFVRLGFGQSGFISNMHLTDAPIVNLTKTREKLFSENKRIKCRITRLDQSSSVPKISLTCKKTLISMDESNIFSDFKSIKPGMSSTGVVCLINESGILLEFFANVRGFIPIKYLATYKIEHPQKVFSIGQLVKCVAVSIDVDANRMVCSLIDAKETKKLKMTKDEKLNNKKLKNSSLEVGQILKKMTIIAKKNKGLDLTNSKKDVQVFLPMIHLSDDPYLSRLLFSTLKVNDSLDQIMIFSVDSANVVIATRKRSFIERKDNLVKCEGDIELNQPFPVVVRNVVPSGVFFATPNNHSGVVRCQQLQDGFYEDATQLGLVFGQTIYVSAYEKNLKVEVNQETNSRSKLKGYKFSMKLSQVWDKDSIDRINMMKSYLKDYHLTTNLFQLRSKEIQSSDISEVESSFLESIKLFSSYSIGEVVTFMITNINDDSIELKISKTGSKNEPTIRGMALRYTDFGDLNISQMGNAIVCDIDFDRKLMLVFIQPTPAKIIRQVQSFTLVRVIFLLRYLAMHPGVIAHIPSRRHRNDLGKIESLYTIGEDYHFTIKMVDDNQHVIAILNTNRKKESKNKKLAKKVKLNAIKFVPEETKNAVSSVLSTTQTDKGGKLKQNIESQFQWEIPNMMPNLNKKRNVDDLNSFEPEEGDDDIEKLFNEEDSEDDSNGNSKKRKTRQERNEDSRQRESELRQKEIELTNVDRTPQDEKDFEMALVASPNSSLTWLKYMSFFLEKGDTAQARSIAERALERISFREEQEKLNIWIGLLNLENAYGDQASMDAMVERAIKYNDSKTIHLQLASIYSNSNKKEKAEQTYHLAIKKFKQDKQVWIEFLVFYMQNDRAESARKLFQRSLISLQKSDHLDVISKFGQLEFKFGDSEKGKTIFESMLATYWKRLDQWSIYIDMLVKYTLEETNLDSIEFIRNIFERLITFKFPPTKMKFVFKKYFDFEIRFSGENSDAVDRIKTKALEYAEGDIF
ncbi:Protein RRP5 [Blomia tropicalis]|nr:Protein RRP5 [Blomia tropicalis]